MSGLTIKDILDIGGLLGFAALVWLQVREQTRVLEALNKEIVTIRTNHTLIIERQRSVADNVAFIGRQIGVEPDKESKH